MKSSDEDYIEFIQYYCIGFIEWIKAMLFSQHGF